jgi:DNA polymerase-3 subunit delta
MPVYLFSGDETYLLQQEIKSLRKRVINPDMAALSHKRLEKPNMGQVLELLGTITFSLGGDSLYEIHEFQPLQKAMEDPADKAQLEALKTLVHETPSDRHVVFISTKIDRKVSFAKWMASQKTFTVKDFKKLDFWKTDDAVQFLMQDAKQKSIQLTPQAAHALVEGMGVDLQVLVNETEKLAIYAHNRPITPDDVKVLSNHHDNTFKMLGLWITGKPKMMVFQILDEILLKQHPVQLYALMQSHLNSLYRLKLLAENGMNPNDIAERVKKHPFKVKKDLEEIQRVPLARLGELKEQLIEMEWKTKTGQINDRLGMEILLSL